MNSSISFCVNAFGSKAKGNASGRDSISYAVNRYATSAFFNWRPVWISMILLVFVFGMQITKSFTNFSNFSLHGLEKIDAIKFK